MVCLGSVRRPSSRVACLQELENPLGFDKNDIDLSGFQDILVSEIHGLYKHAFGETMEARPKLTKAQNAFAGSVLGALRCEIHTAISGSCLFVCFIASQLTLNQLMIFIASQHMLFVVWLLLHSTR